MKSQISVWLPLHMTPGKVTVYRVAPRVWVAACAPNGIFNLGREEKVVFSRTYNGARLTAIEMSKPSPWDWSP